VKREVIRANLRPSPMQRAIIGDDHRTVVACCGRRVGKTWAGAHWIARRVHRRLDARVMAVRAGREQRWPGEGRPARICRYIQPDVLAWVVTPRDTHLDEIRGHLLRLYSRPGWREFLHPAFPGGIYDRGRQLWLLHCGVCARIDFIPASGEARMVGRGLDVLWIDEAGFIDNGRYQAIRPATMDRRAEILASGTPAVLGDDHWFTRLAQSGLEATHERAHPEVERDPETVTYIADTIQHAALEEARVEAVREARFWGERWAAQWIYADWRQRGRHVFPEWTPSAHIRAYEARGPWWYLGDTRLDRPDQVVGIVDWTGGSAPGAFVVVHVWRRNPLAVDDPRPLVVCVADHQGHEAYTMDGWWGLMHDAERRYGIGRWIGDPHAPHLIAQAQANGLWVEPGPAQDKGGRLNMVGAMLHHGEDVVPALYVSTHCEHIARQFSAYVWRVTREGHITDKPRQYDDHCLDCLAMLMPEIEAGACQIGHERYH